MILVTGAAGFIGAAVAQRLLKAGETVLGVDNLNGYYEVSLKEARRALLASKRNFHFRKSDISDAEEAAALAREFPDISAILHFAAQPGVRYSLVNPYAYVQANVMGQVTMLELARRLKTLRHFVYASSSSVYGSNENVPFSVADRVDRPNSLYAATKRADELIAHTYAHLYGIACTGLRFFTVYGPWGRPDMAPMIFTRAILKGQPIKLFNRGEMWRDFTYIDDIVEGVLGALARPASGTPPHRLYNLGNSSSEKLTTFLAQLEDALQRKAVIQLEPMQPGDVERTYADIEASRRDLGFDPSTPIAVGVPKFVEWYRRFYDGQM